MTAAERETGRLRKGRIRLFVSAAALAIAGCCFLFVWKLPVIARSRQAFTLSDFIYHIALARGIFFDGLGSPYILPNQIQVLSELAGEPLKAAMPVGVTPAAWIAWLPFAAIAEASMQLAYSLWVFCSVFAFLLLAFGRAGSAVGNRRALILTGCIAAVCVLSETFRRSVALGQTSLAASAALLLLDNMSGEDNPKGVRRFALPVALLCMWMKPVYGILGGALLLARGEWRMLVRTAAVLLVSSALMTPLLGLSWPAEYAASLSLYSKPEMPQEYRSAIAGQTMNIFRYAFGPILGEEAALKVSLILFPGAIAALALLLGVPAVRGRGGSALALEKWYLLGGLLLLFPPYSGGYEDLLVVPMLLIWGKKNFTEISAVAGALLVAALFVVLNFADLRTALPLPLLWGTKALLFLLPGVILFAAPSRTRQSL